MKKLLTLTGAALALSTSFAIASDYTSNKISFEKLDLNSDGVITINEASSKMSKHFRRLDLDNNAAITKMEFNSRGHKKLKHQKATHKYDNSNDNGRNSDQ